MSAQKNPRVRGTQSLVTTFSHCMRQPSLLAMEVAWRWVAGIPTIWLVLREGKRILDVAQLAQSGISQFTLLDQTRSTYEIMRCVELLWPPMVETAKWMLPLMVLLWGVTSGIGRMLVISRASDKTFTARWQWKYLPALIVLQMARVTALMATLLVLVRGIGWAASWSIIAPLHSANPEPNIVAFLAAAITLSVTLLAFWSAGSWIFNAAPVMVLADGRGVFSSLAAAMRLGWLRGKLVEINLMLTVIKLALIVLVIVLSSTPLPFETVVSGSDLYGWWEFVMVLFCVASDQFHVVRSVSYIEMLGIWRRSQQA